MESFSLILIIKHFHKNYSLPPQFYFFNQFHDYYSSRKVFLKTYYIIYVLNMITFLYHFWWQYILTRRGSLLCSIICTKWWQNGQNLKWHFLIFKTTLACLTLTWKSQYNKFYRNKWSQMNYWSIVLSFWAIPGGFSKNCWKLEIINS